MANPKYIEKYLTDNPSGYFVGTIHELVAKYGKRVAKVYATDNTVKVWGCGVVRSKSNYPTVYSIIGIDNLHELPNLESTLKSLNII